MNSRTSRLSADAVHACDHISTQAILMFEAVRPEVCLQRIFTGGASIMCGRTKTHSRLRAGSKATPPSQYEFARRTSGRRGRRSRTTRASWACPSESRLYPNQRAKGSRVCKPAKHPAAAHPGPCQLAVALVPNCTADLQGKPFCCTSPTASSGRKGNVAGKALPIPLLVSAPSRHTFLTTRAFTAFPTSPVSMRTSCSSGASLEMRRAPENGA